jgi:hypothetical protein
MARIRRGSCRRAVKTQWLKNSKLQKIEGFPVFDVFERFFSILESLPAFMSHCRRAHNRDERGPFPPVSAAAFNLFLMILVIFFSALASSGTLLDLHACYTPYLPPHATAATACSLTLRARKRHVILNTKRRSDSAACSKRLAYCSSPQQQFENFHYG